MSHRRKDCQRQKECQRIDKTDCQMEPSFINQNCLWMQYLFELLVSITTLICAPLFSFSDYNEFSAFISTEPITEIAGGPDLFINKGSTINLTCIVKYAPEAPSMVWSHNREVSLTLSVPIFPDYAATNLYLSHCWTCHISVTEISPLAQKKAADNLRAPN